MTDDTRELREAIATLAEIVGAVCKEERDRADARGADDLSAWWDDDFQRASQIATRLRTPPPPPADAPHWRETAPGEAEFVRPKAADEVPVGAVVETALEALVDAGRCWESGIDSRSPSEIEGAEYVVKEAKNVVRDALRTAQQEAARLREELAEAAREINCAGPVAHRIRVQRKELQEIIERQCADLAQFRALAARAQAHTDLFRTGAETAWDIARDLASCKAQGLQFYVQSAASAAVEGK